MVTLRGFWASATPCTYQCTPTYTDCYSCEHRYAFVATDAAIHIAEEMKRPSSQLPLILNSTIVIGFLTTLPLILAMMFTIRDLDAVLASPLPSLEVYYQATGSAAAATGLQVILTITFFNAIMSEWVTCSRMVWAFARDVSLSPSLQ
jgi:choline transport protein